MVDGNKGWMRLLIMLMLLFISFSYSLSVNASPFFSSSKESENGDEESQGCRKSSLTIRNNSGLQFGSISVSSTGSVTVSTNGSRTATGDVFLFDSQSSYASFDVKGCSDSSYKIELPDSIYIRSGEDKILVDSFSSDPSKTVFLDGSGYKELKVGATLHVDTQQSPGEYSGSFVIEIEYE